MFSRALFKQSAKANWVTWLLVALASILMLGVITYVMGTSDISSIRDSMVTVFQDNVVESTTQGAAMSFYHFSDQALLQYDNSTSQLGTLFTTLESSGGYTQITQGYQMLINMGMTDEEARHMIKQQGGQMGLTEEIVDTTLDYYLVKGSDISELAIGDYCEDLIVPAIKEVLEEEYEGEILSTMTTLLDDSFRFYRAQDEDRATFLTQYISTFTSLYIDDVISENGLDYSLEYLEDVAHEACMILRGRLAIEPDLDIEELVSEYSTSFLDSIPEDVANSLTELQTLDVFALVVGTIFFRTAGLLLPIVFIIMVSNNLIVNQVDSGSMAYVLSTPTKRSTVVNTQILYLVASILGIALLTTIVGELSIFLLGGESSVVTINYLEMLYLNIGLLGSMFAIGGICFLASCWFDRQKLAMSVGGGISMFFLVCVIIGLFGSQVIPSALRIDAMQIFNYISLFSLFDVNSILNNTIDWVWEVSILFGIGIICFIISTIRFKKKDLPL